MTVAVYDGPNGRFVGQVYTIEDLWFAANIALRRTGEVWLHGRIGQRTISEGFTSESLYTNVVAELLPVW